MANKKAMFAMNLKAEWAESHKLTADQTISFIAIHSNPPIIVAIFINNNKTALIYPLLRAHTEQSRTRRLTLSLFSKQYLFTQSFRLCLRFLRRLLFWTFCSVS